MKVEFTHGLASDRHSWDIGDVDDLPATEARSLIAAKFAVATDKPIGKANAGMGGVETAVAATAKVERAAGKGRARPAKASAAKAAGK